METVTELERKRKRSTCTHITYCRHGSLPNWLGWVWGQMDGQGLKAILMISIKIKK